MFEISYLILVVAAKLAHYVYPLMDMGYVDPRLEYLRLGGLGVIVHLLKEVRINILKHTLFYFLITISLCHKSF